MSRYRFVEVQRDHYPVRLLCQLMEVLASSYYAWQNTPQQVVTQLEPAWETALVKVRCLGSTSAVMERVGCASNCGARAAAPTHRRGLHALQPKAFTPRTSDSTHGLHCAPNRLLDQPKLTQANRVWVSIYLPLANGDWAYLCAFQEVASKQIVGWHVGATIPEELVNSALQRAFGSQPPTPDLLVHSDRGGQYCGKAYRQMLHDHQAVRSQSRRGDCDYNAQADSGRASKRRCSKWASDPFLRV
jgi:putative transposase